MAVRVRHPFNHSATQALWLSSARVICARVNC